MQNLLLFIINYFSAPPYGAHIIINFYSLLTPGLFKDRMIILNFYFSY